ncbi:MAG: leucine--tRNA ligase [Chitinophagales bacterium]
MELDFSAFEAEAKEFWAANQVYQVNENASKPKFYVLDMFPYPSGAGLHVGHPLGYVAGDIYARYKRLKGFNVLHPMGYDAFGLPAEQYAIETGTHPAITTEKAIKRYREQLDKIGFSFDWSREVRTSDPEYYKWTQWIFLKLYRSWYNRAKNKAEPIETLIEQFEQQGTLFEGKLWSALDREEQNEVLMNYRLAYLSFAEVNWCEALGCVLANDEVKDGKSERGGYPVEKRKMRQWFLRITEYSDRLLEGLDRIDWSESLKEQQRNWIGRSEGALVNFVVLPENKRASADPLVLEPLNFHTLLDDEHAALPKIEVFTTRPDTIFGATFLVLAPEHELVSQLTTESQRGAVEEYVAYVKSRSDIERQAEKKVTGVFTGAYAWNPFTQTAVPIWLAEYVLAGYGTGAIMAVPADDERDRKFAEKFSLPVIEVIDKSAYPNAEIGDKVGMMVNSGLLNGLEVKAAIPKILEELEKMGVGTRKVNYKQRDAIYSRQRYWGEPIPVRYHVIDEPDTPFGENNDIPHALADQDLPLRLPEVSSYKPSGDGRSPLANNADWVRQGYETDTMPGYAGSSWYFLRYMDPHNATAFAAKEKLDYWRDVDLYIGGSEHAVGHLLYSRFWHKFLFDLGYVPTDEPFKKLVNQGMIQGMSMMVKVDVIRDENNEGVKYRMHDDAVSGSADAAIHHYPVEFVKFEGGKYILTQDAATQTAKKYPGRAAYFIDANRASIELTPVVEKMSKSKLNVINPDDVIEKYGADCFRMFEMFLGPIEQSKPWDDKGISGVSGFLKKYWRLFYEEGKQVWTDDAPTAAELKVLHKLLRKIEIDIERLSFNTCVSAFMIAVNELSAMNCRKKSILQPLTQALAPFAPFVTEKLWKLLGNAGSIHQSSFPKVEEQYLVENTFVYPVSINGKVRANIELALDLDEAQVRETLLQHEAVAKWVNGVPLKKFIFVKGRIVNLVI